MFDPLKRLLLALIHALYGVFALAVFGVLGLLAFLVVSAPLSVRARRRAAHLIARGYFFAACIPIRVVGVEHLPPGPCVVVANHASYADGVLLKAVLPARFTFVIKKEVSRTPLAGLLLRRIGSEFVDRFNRHAGGMDTRRLIKAADAGQALAFFPEGTFRAQPGLGKFHSGAFAIAVRAALPVTPIAIRGTRWILPSGRFLPRPGAIHIEVLPPVGPFTQVDAPTALSMLRDHSRARILAALGEPDLEDADGVAALQSRRP